MSIRKAKFGEPANSDVMVVGITPSGRKDYRRVKEGTLDVQGWAPILDALVNPYIVDELNLPRTTPTFPATPYLFDRDKSLVLWFKNEYLNQIPSTGSFSLNLGKVTVSGLGHNITKSASGVNGRPGIASVAEPMAGNIRVAELFRNRNESHQFFVVDRTNAVGPYIAVFCNFSLTTDDNYQLTSIGFGTGIFSGNNWLFTGYGSGTANFPIDGFPPPFPTGSKYVFEIATSGNRMEVYTNGRFFTTFFNSPAITIGIPAEVNTSDVCPFFIGPLNLGEGTTPILGDILIFNRSLNREEAGYVHSYLMNKYGI